MASRVADDGDPTGARSPVGHHEPGGSWRPLWTAAAALALLIGLDVAVGAVDVPTPVWVLVAAVVLGLAAAGCLSARRLWTVRVEGRGEDTELVVGRERVPLRLVDAEHLAAVRGGTAGVDAGAPVLGGGWSLPAGRSGLPLRLADGHTVLVPTRHPAELAAAVLTAHPGRTPAGHSGDTGGPGSPHRPEPPSPGAGTLGS
ncbi:hypothetical protein [Goekera deserti]|uniref:hypothetical protein n=1 Tax=Goekera deserti TaxID=2497753 RepID=UPI0018778362|nr:hypothetical protein [Goekera deserti]